MKVLFIIDRIELKYFESNDLVTNFWFIKGLLEKGAQVDIATIDNLGLRGGIAYSNSRKSYLKDGNIFFVKEFTQKDIESYNLVMFRPDPPVDLDYINATYIFDFVDENKTRVINSPRAIRNFNEKLHTVKRRYSGVFRGTRTSSVKAAKFLLWSGRNAFEKRRCKYNSDYQHNDCKRNTHDYGSEIH